MSHIKKDNSIMLASLLNKILQTHVMHDWIEIDNYRYCKCGTLEHCDMAATSQQFVNWEDDSKDYRALSEFKGLADGMGINLN
jgi:hypothetical protein